MKVRLLPNADIELEEAVRYYDHQLPGLGTRFYLEAKATIDRITLMPLAWPNSLLYVVEPGIIIVTAVAHCHRDPEHYRKRIE